MYMLWSNIKLAILSVSLYVTEQAQLQKIIDAQAAENATLREVLATIGTGEGDLRDAKLIQLFKKNKALNVQLASERLRNKKVRKIITVIQQELLRREKGEENKDKTVKMGIHYWVDKYQRAVF